MSPAWPLQRTLAVDEGELRPSATRRVSATDSPSPARRTAPANGRRQTGLPTRKERRTMNNGKKSVKAIPDGMRGIIPHLIVRGAAQAIEFYKKAFGATEVMRMPG